MSALEEHAPDRRVLTLPNLISFARLLCIPLFLWLLFGLEDRLVAAALLGVLGATDWVDGFLARRLGQVSELGKMLDPVADRLLLLVGVGGILLDGSAPLWLGLVVVVREAIVGGTVLVLAALGARRIDVVWVGKAGTFALMFAFPLFLLGNADFRYAGVATLLAWCWGLPGLALSLYAAVQYVPEARRALAEGRVGSTP